MALWAGFMQLLISVLSHAFTDFLSAMLFSGLHARWRPLCSARLGPSLMRTLTTKPCLHGSRAFSNHHCTEVQHHTKITQLDYLRLLGAHQQQHPLKLHLITSECPLWWVRDESELPFVDAPWWAFVWPGGYGQSQYVLQNAHKLADKRILDFGCGSGLAAVCAKATGTPSHVAAVDIDPVACAATQLNAGLNGVVLDEVICENVIGWNKERLRCDVIMLGDMCYDEELATAILPWLHDLWRDDVDIVLCDPGRAWFPKPQGSGLEPAYEDIGNKRCIDAAEQTHHQSENGCATDKGTSTIPFKTRLLATFPVPQQLQDQQAGITDVMISEFTL